MHGANQNLRLYRMLADPDELDDLGRSIASTRLRDVFMGNLFEETTRELTDGQWITVSQWTALVPPGIEITHRDVITDESGRRFRVVSAHRRRGPDGRVRHVACDCVLEEA